MRQITLLIGLAVLISTAAISACTTVKGTVTHACDTTRSSLATGLNHSTNTVLPGSAPDGKWIVIKAPKGVTPRQATVITTPPWAPAPGGSQWIGPYTPAQANAVKLPDAPVGDYSYLYCFCLCDKNRLEFATLQGALRADNGATVYLNGVKILSKTVNNTFDASKFPDPVPFVANSGLIRRGLNCLRSRRGEPGGPHRAQRHRHDHQALLLQGSDATAETVAWNARSAGRAAGERRSPVES
jgi:hypothetical protein